MGSMTLAAVLVLLAWPTRWRWPVVAAMAAFVPMVGLSRVYLGVHFPSDILAGWAAALAWTAGAYLLVFRWDGRPWGSAAASRGLTQRVLRECARGHAGVLHPACKHRRSRL